MIRFSIFGWKGRFGFSLHPDGLGNKRHTSVELLDKSKLELRKDPATHRLLHKRLTDILHTIDSTKGSPDPGEFMW